MRYPVLVILGKYEYELKCVKGLVCIVEGSTYVFIRRRWCGFNQLPTAYEDEKHYENLSYTYSARIGCVVLSWLSWAGLVVGMRPIFGRKEMGSE
jgi:hypothetical protein